MTLIKQLNYILSKSDKKEIKIITFLMFIGMILEMGGIGILLPTISFFTDPNVFTKYSIYFPESIKNIEHTQLLMLGFSIIIIFYIVKSLFLIYLSYRQSKFTAELSVSLSNKLYKGYIDMDYISFTNKNTSDLIKNIQTEILYFGGISLAAMALCTEISAIFGISLLLILIEPNGSLIIITFFGLFSFLFNKLTKKRIKKLGIERQNLDQITSKFLYEGISGSKEIKLLGVEGFFYDKFAISNFKKSKVHAYIQVLNSIPRLYLELLAVFGISLLVFILSTKQNNSMGMLSIVGVFVASAFRLIPSINKIINQIQIILFARPVLNTLSEEFSKINIQKKSVEIYSNIKFNFVNSIILKNISYIFPETSRYILNNINLQINKGDLVGFIGKTGSGKSTLINLIIGLHKPNNGTITVDNSVDIFSNINEWQKKIGYVPQNLYLLDDTILNNIAFGIKTENINIEKVNNAIKLAQLDNFIKACPLKMDTIVGERGIKLSGGERQRIGIARALYNNPEILILDEATSALDNETEKEFMNSVNSLYKLKTILIIAHRLTTVKNCDKIFEISNGNLQEVNLN